MHASTHLTDRPQPLDGAPGHADRDTLIRWYGLMHLGRVLDERIAHEHGVVRESALLSLSPFTSCAGYEALQLALGLHVRAGQDILFPRRGDLVTALAANISPENILLTAFGKTGAPAGGGRGARDMFADPGAGLPPAGTSEANRVRQAAGLARAYRSHDESGIVFCSLDAAAAAQGTLFEVVSDAAHEQLRVLFVLVSDGDDGDDGDGYDGIGELEAIARLRLVGCDGANIFDAWQAMEDATEYVRSGAGPAVLRAACGRSEHSGDPVARYRHWLLDSATAEEGELDTVEKDNFASVDAAAARAERAPGPDPSSVQQAVFMDDTHACPLSNEEFSRLMAKHAGELDTLTLRESIGRSITDEFRRNPSTFLLAQHTPAGGANRHADFTAAMENEFGGSRVMRLSYSASHLIGNAIGLCRYRDDIWTVVDAAPTDDGVPAALQEIIVAAESSWRSAGGFTPNILLRAAVGGTGSTGAMIFRNIESFLAGIPGIRIVMPAFADDAAGLLRCAFRTRGLTVFLEPASFYDHETARSLHPTPELCVPIGRARIRREGGDLSVITYGGAVHRSLQAAEALSGQGIETEVVDLRSILPFDTEAIRASVGRTGRALVVHEAQQTGGFGGELAAWIGEHCFDDLDAPVRRLAARDIPATPSGPLTDAIVPAAAEIEAAAGALVQY